MKTFVLCALAASGVAKKVVAIDSTECSHTTCEMIKVPTPLGSHEVMRVTHDNLEEKCARFQTVSRNAGLDNHKEDQSKKVHCGRIKTWVEDDVHTSGGSWQYNGPCKCHVAGTHPNGNDGLLEMHATEAPKPTAAPIEHGVTMVETTNIETKLKLPNFTVSSFTPAVQNGVKVAVARSAGVHRDQVTISNVQATLGRRLAESADDKAPGITFDVNIEVTNSAAVAKVEKTFELVDVNGENAAQEHFAELMVEETVKSVLAHDDGATPAATLALLRAIDSVPVVAAPTKVTSSQKAGCYIKAHSCPNHKWATGKWVWHSHGSKMGKAYCLSDADNHHKSCGGDVTDPWSQKWVDSTGEFVTTYPEPGCYWKLEKCPNHPSWLTTTDKGGSTASWRRHGIKDQATCISSAWSHHKLCGLSNEQLSATMFIGDENSNDPELATTHALSCGDHRDVKLPIKAASMSSVHPKHPAALCIDGDTTDADQGIEGSKGMCHSSRENAWIKLEMDTEFVVSSVTIYNRPDGTQLHRFGDHVIETADTTDGPWTECFSGTLPATAGPHEETCKATARFVRARMTGNGNSFLNLAEITVMGRPLCGVRSQPHLSVSAPSAAAGTALWGDGRAVKPQFALGNTGTPNVANSGWGCPVDYMEITDSEECKTAGRSFLGDATYDALPHAMQKGSGLHKGSWTIPTNCGYRAGAYLTFGTEPGKDGWWPKLCKLTPKTSGGCSVREGTRRQHWKGEGNILAHIGKRNGGQTVTDDTCCAACQARSDCKSWSTYVGTSANDFPDGLCRLLDQEWHPNEGTWYTNSKYNSGGRS